MARTVGSSGAKTADAIRAAAMRLIARHGYEAMSLRALAQEVGLQTASLYRYFPSKQEMLRDLMVAHMTDLLGAWERASLRAGEPREMLSAFVRFHLDYHLDRPDAVFLSYMELRSLTPAHRKLVTSMRARYEQILRDILTRGVEAGAFRIDDVTIASMAIIAMLTGVNVWYRPKGRLSRARIVEIYTMMALGVVESHAS
jgi:AcrR family transcriptional regulator